MPELNFPTLQPVGLSFPTLRPIGFGSLEGFVFTVQTSGVDDTFTLPIYNGGSYDFVVDWGDGNNEPITTFDDPGMTHTYAAEGL